MEPTATAAEVKRAYRKLAFEHHPDRNPGDPGAERRFKEIATAFAEISDPARRDRNRVSPHATTGPLPDDFLDHAASAVERAQTWFERGVLPHYVRFWRGRGAEMSARLVRDLDLIGDPSRLRTESSPARLRRAAGLLSEISLVLEPGRAYSSSALSLRPGGWIITISPWALYQAGFREPAEIDDALMRIVVARYVQVLAAGRFRPPQEETPEGWERAVADARDVDGAYVRARLGRTALWIAVTLAIAVMVTAGWLGI